MTQNVQILPSPAATAPRRVAGPWVRPESGTSRSRSEFFARCVRHLPKSAWAVIDGVTICLGNYIGYRLFEIQFPRSTWLADLPLVNVVTAVCFVAAGVLCGLYDGETLRHRSRIILRSILTSIVALAMAYVVMHALMYEVYSRRIAMVAPIAFLGVAGSLRMLAHRLLWGLQRRILFVGHGDSIRHVIRTLQESPACKDYTLVGHVDPGRPADDLDACPALGRLSEIHTVCLDHEVHEVVIGVEESSGAELSYAIMSCLRMGCRVTNQPTFYERIFGEVPVDYITADWFLFADLDGHHEDRSTLKRISDFALALIGLIVTLPAWPIIALAIRLEDGGPVLYSQNRIGCHNRLFRLTKFRTMRPDAEADGHAWAVPGDPRVTRVGRFLRRSHLDELPQLWNVLLGDMSVVGPRPERPEFVDQLVDEIPFYDERHLVKPGLTGWAQINYRYGCSTEDARRKLFLDLYYIKHMSLELDLVILCRTITALLGRAGGLQHA